MTTNYDLVMWLVSKGLEKLNPMNTSGTTDLGGFTVSLVRADHSSGEMANGVSVYLGNPCGAIIKAPGEPTIYHMGDTDIFSEHFLRHGSDCRNPSAAHRHGPDWRSLYDERGHRCDGDQALFQARLRESD